MFVLRGCQTQGRRHFRVNRRPADASRVLFVTVLVGFLLSACGCATLMHHGGKQEVRIKSSPPGASVTVDNIPLLGKKTPLTVKLSRKKSHLIKFEMPGYEPYVTRVGRAFNWWAAFDFIPYWVYIALPVDWLTGAMYRLRPEEIWWNVSAAGPASASIASTARLTMKNIAVAKLGASGVSASDAAVIADMLRGELFNTGSFNVIEKRNMEQILAEQAFQQTGCTTQHCAIKLGKLLNVQAMVVGSFGKLMERYIVSIRVVDVESGKVMYADKAKGETVDQIDRELKDMAVRIALRVY